MQLAWDTGTGVTQEMHKHLISDVTALVVGAARAVPIFESNEATLYMQGYFAAHI
jgi:hypothetical protein